METIELNVNVREKKGKGVARQTRLSGGVPGIFYGPHMKEPVKVSFDALEFQAAKKNASTNSIFSLADQGSKKALSGKMAMLKDVQVHPVTGENIHVDLYEVHEGEELSLTVPLVLDGKPKGIANGGLLQQIRRKLPIRCLPKNIPDEVIVDVSGLDVGDNVHIQDVPLPEGVSPVGTANFTIASVVSREKEAAKALEAEEAAPTSVEPEVTAQKSESESESAASEGEDK